MVIDSSAIIAILRGEAEAAAFVRAIHQAHICRMSVVNFVEVGAVIDSSRDPVVSRRFDEFLAVANIDIEPVDADQARIARSAYRDFGKGSGHAAKLNFGDCFAYALAKSVLEPLLFKGNDFIHTDVAFVLSI